MSTIARLPKERYDNVFLYAYLILVETSNADNKDLFFGNLLKNIKKIFHEKDYPIFDKLVGYAIKYFNDVIKKDKKYKKPNSDEKKALEALIKKL